MKKLIAYLILIFLLLTLFSVGIGTGWFLNDQYKKQFLSNDLNFGYNHSLVSINNSNVPDNLSIHLCSSECIYEIKLVDENKINDSFIINNKLNNSNCNKCPDKYLESR